MLNYIFLQAAQSSITHLVAGIAIGIIMLLLMASMMVYFVIKFVTKQRNYEHRIALLKKDFEAQILQSQLEIQEQTFTSISEEIHDNVGQILSLAKMQLNIAEAKTNAAENEMIVEAKQNISRALTDLRDVARNLHTNKIAQQPLLKSLEIEIERLKKVIACTLVVTGKEPNLNGQLKVLVFRIIQESCSNALKHAQAKNIAIELNFDTNCTITITDDGIGFNTNTIANNSGLGLQNIYIRMSLVNGKAFIDSKENLGTKVTVAFPYEQ